MSVFCRATMQFAQAGGLQSGLTPVDVDIRDGRAADLPGWQACGFELLAEPSAVTDWTDDTQIASVHYAESEALARRLTGCDAALVSDHVKRSGEQTKRQREQEPVRLVHSDFAAGYDTIVRRAYREVHGRGAATLARVGVTSADIESARRIVMMQLWRNLGPARPDLPVAWCDSRTVQPSDTKPFQYNGYVAGGFTFDALAVLSPAHPDDMHWHTFPGMTADEVVAFRTYDTELVADDRTWFTPHSAFRDPAVEEGSAPRFSIELRVMCLYF